MGKADLQSKNKEIFPKKKKQIKEKQKLSIFKEWTKIFIDFLFPEKKIKIE